MVAAQVTLKEIDLSTRVPSFPGVFGGIVIPATKGDTTKPTLVTSDTQFLSLFSPDGRIEVGYDLSYFSALAYLQKSNKLWVTRAVKSALYGGLVLKSSTSAYTNLGVAAGMADPTAYVFDAGVDAAAVAEVTQFTFSQPGSFYDVIGAGKSLQLFNSLAVGHYFWFNVTDGVNTPQTDPTGTGTGHQVDVLLADTAAQVATKFFTQVALVVAAFTAANPSAGVVNVTNATAGTATNATATGTAAAISVTTQGAAAVTTVDEAILLHGANQGVWNNSVGVKVTRYVTNPDKVKEPNSFMIEVFKSSNTVVPVETFICSRVPGAKDGFGRNIYVEDVLGSSQYIRAIDNVAITSSVQPKDQASYLAMTFGSDGLAVTDAEMISTSNQLAAKDSYPLTVFMDGGFATPAYGQQLDGLVSSRQDSVSVLSVPFSDESSASYITDIVDYRKAELNLNSSYSALYTPHVKIYDRFNDRNIYVSPEGYAAGAISETASTFEIWFPPAGFRRGLVRVLDLRRRFTQGEMDTLYNAGINPLRFTPGKGIAIWGQKTLLSRPSALDRLNVRLLLITVEPAIAEALEDFLFELNDIATQSLVTAIIEGYLNNILSRRGLIDFRVVCDSTNNTPDDIDNNRLNVDVFMKPTRAIEEIPLRAVIVSTGVSFDTAAAAI